ncbi:MAG: flavin reductase family protein [Ruminococcaceae bacterium]|nr:flavin reductase family protein [Oscillospiraceae bacterium]
MSKKEIKPSTMLNPVPVVMVSSGDMEKSNIFTAAWTGTICSEPPMVYVSIRKSRYSHEIISEKGTYVINMVGKDTVKACDFCGVKSGRDVDKFAHLGLTKEAGPKTGVPMIKECPVNLECKVTQVLELGSHDMFLAEVVGVYVDGKLMDDKNAIDLVKAHLVAYSHGEYFELGDYKGFFGYSIAGEDALKRRLRK